MKKREAASVTSPGYYVVGPTGAPVKGPFNTPSDALAALAEQRGFRTGVQFLSGDPGTSDWQVSKPKPFPYGLNTVVGALDSDGHCPVCDATGDGLLVNSEPDEDGQYDVECAACGWSGKANDYTDGPTDLTYYDEGGNAIGAEASKKCRGCGEPLESGAKGDRCYACVRAFKGPKKKAGKSWEVSQGLMTVDTMTVDAFEQTQVLGILPWMEEQLKGASGSDLIDVQRLHSASGTYCMGLRPHVDDELTRDASRKHAYYYDYEGEGYDNDDLPNLYDKRDYDGRTDSKGRSWNSETWEGPEAIPAPDSLYALTASDFPHGHSECYSPDDPYPAICRNQDDCRMGMCMYSDSTPEAQKEMREQVGNFKKPA